MDPHAVPQGPAPRPPRIVWLGLGIVLAAAAVLSFEALRALALAVGIPARFAWLLPVAVDAGAAVSCATWLGRRATPDAARFAGRLTWSLLAVTVVGNAGQLGMHAYGITPPWWVAALVGVIPPAVVGATVHLVVLLVRRSETAETTRTTEEVAVGPSTVGQRPMVDEPAPGSSPVQVADQDQTTPDPLLDEAVRWAAGHPGPLSQRAVRTRFNVGADRARRIHEAIAQEVAS